MLSARGDSELLVVSPATPASSPLNVRRRKAVDRGSGHGVPSGRAGVVVATAVAAVPLPESRETSADGPKWADDDASNGMPGPRRRGCRGSRAA